MSAKLFDDTTGDVGDSGFISGPTWIGADGVARDLDSSPPEIWSWLICEGFSSVDSW